MRTLRENRKGRRFFRTVLALLMAAALVAPVTASAVSQADIDALKGDAGALADQKKELQAKLEALAEDKAAAMDRKALLDQQISNTEARISNVQSQIASYEELIAQTEAELAEAQEQEADQYDLFCRRVRAMEKRGRISYWSVLFKADSFTDLLTRLNDANEVMEADQRVIDQLRQLQEEIAAKQAELEEQKAAAEEARDELVRQKAELNTQRTAANAVIQELTENENATEAALDEMEAEEKAIQAEIQRLSRELAAQQAANGGSSQSNPGGYIWPVDSRYITSTVGGRSSPGGIGSTNHKGTDIGRVYYTSPVYAAKAGTVIVATYSKSYGNYVAISHGSGNTTLYAHMSSLKVSAGQYVNQGDVIGITGSTGNSTGPHLHFEVTENGSIINPLSDGAEPKKGYLSGYTLSGTASGT